VPARPPGPPDPFPPTAHRALAATAQGGGGQRPPRRGGSRAKRRPGFGNMFKGVNCTLHCPLGNIFIRVDTQRTRSSGVVRVVRSIARRRSASSKRRPSVQVSLRMFHRTGSGTLMPVMPSTGARPSASCRPRSAMPAARRLASIYRPGPKIVARYVPV